MEHQSARATTASEQQITQVINRLDLIKVELIRLRTTLLPEEEPTPRRRGSWRSRAGMSRRGDAPPSRICWKSWAKHPCSRS